MIKVTVGNNAGRYQDIFSENDTLRSAFEKYDIDYSRGLNQLDGTTLQPGDLDKTFKDFGITSKCWLLSTVKTDNA